MKIFAILLVAFALTACASPNVDPKVNFITTLAVTCDGYASALAVLANRRALGKLTPKQVRTINAAYDVVHPVCGKGAVVPDARTALGLVVGEINKLVLMKGQ